MRHSFLRQCADQLLGGGKRFLFLALIGGISAVPANARAKNDCLAAFHNDVPARPWVNLAPLYRVMIRWLSLLFLAFLPCVAFAQNTALVVWLDDTGSDGFFKSLDKSEQKKMLALYEQRVPGVNFKTVFLPVTESEKISDQVAMVLPEGIPVSHLIVATHGSYNSTDDRTELGGFGGFDAAGPSGKFKDLLNLLSERKNLDSEIHLYLNACSSLCGTERAAFSRADGVANYLKQFGVSKFSLWGGTRFLTAVDFRDSPRMKVFLFTHKVSAKAFVAMTALLGVGAIVNRSLPGFFDEALRYYFAGFGTAEAASLMLTLALWKFAGTQGRLFTSDDRGSRLQELDGHSDQAYRGRSCSSLFREM